MKKVINGKGGSSKGSPAKGVDNGELKKPTKLKPLKEKEKKGWKNKLGEDDEDDFILENDLKFDNAFDDEDDEIFDDEY